MAKSEKSRILAMALCASVMAGIYTSPVMAAQTGLTGKIDDANNVTITAGTTVTINGVTLEKNTLSAATGAFTTGNFTGNVTVGGTFTATGKITGNNGSAITATKDASSKATSTVASTAITNTVQKYTTDDNGQGKFVNAATSTIGTTGITDTAYDADGKAASSMALTATSAKLTSGLASVTVDGSKNNITIAAGTRADNYGTVTVTSKNFGLSAAAMSFKNTNGETVFNVSNAGAVTANGAITGNNGMTVKATADGKSSVSSSVTTAGITNTVKKYDNDNDSFVNGASSSITGTTITDTVYGADGKSVASSLALNATGATLKAGAASVAVTGANGNVAITAKSSAGNGTFTVTSSNFGLTATGMNFKKADGTNVFSVTNAGAVTAAGSFTANGAINGNNGMTVKATKNESGQATSSVTGTAITNTVKKYDKDAGSFVNGASSSITGTGITDTVYGTDGKNSSMTLNATSATLKAGTASVGVNSTTGAFSVTSNNFTLGTSTGMVLKDSTGTNTFFSVDKTGKMTANNGSAIIAKGSKNAVASSNVAAAGVTDKFTNDDVTVSTEVNANGITDTFISKNADGSSVTHKVQTKADGTTFTGDTSSDRYNTTRIDGSNAYFGSNAKAQTVIKGGAITTNQITSGEFIVDDNNKWTKDGLTVGGTTLKTDANGNLVVSGLDIENVQLDADGFKLGKKGAETFTVDSATGEVTAKGNVTAADFKISDTVSLSSVNARTEGINKTEDGSTVIEGSTTIDRNGISVKDDRSNEVFSVNTTTGDVTAGDFRISDEVSLGSVAENTAGISRDENNRFTTIEESLYIGKDGIVLTGAAKGKAVFAVESATGNVTAIGDVTANDFKISDDVTLSGLNERTKGISKTDEGTVIEKNTTISESGIAVKNSDGTETFKIDAETGNVTAADFKNADGKSFNELVTTVGTATDNIKTLTQKTAGISRDTDAGKTTIEENTTIDKDGIVVKSDTGSTKIKANGFYIKDADGSNVSELTSNGLRVADTTVVNVDKNGKVRISADIYSVGGKQFASVDTDGNVNLKADTATFGSGNEGSSNVRIKEDGIYVKTGKDVDASLTSAGLKLGDNTLNADQLGYINGMVTGEGTLANVTTLNGAAIESVAANGEYSSAGLKVAGVTLQDGLVNGVDVKELSDDVTQAGTDISSLKQKTDGIVRRGDSDNHTTEIEGTVSINNNQGFYVKDKEGNTAAKIDREGNITANGDATIGGNFITKNDDGKAVISSTQVTLSKTNGAGESVSNVLIRNDGLARFGALDSQNVRIEDGVLKINSAYEKGEVKLSTDGLTIGAQTLTEDAIYNIGGIDREEIADGVYKTTIEETLEVSKDSINYADGAFTVDNSGALSAANGAFTVDANGTLTAGDSFMVSQVDGAVFSMNGTSTNIKGGSISVTDTKGTTTITGDTITTGTLNVDKIVLGDQIVDKETGETIGGELEIGADGSIKISNEDTDVFVATKTEFEANYGEYDLGMDEDGFSLKNNSGAFFGLDNDGFRFNGSVNLGKSSDVGFTHNGDSMNLSDLVGRVENLEDKTTGIEFDKTTGNTTITNMKPQEDGTFEKGDSSLVVGSDGTTFTNGEDNGKTNINGGVINADRTEIGDIPSGGDGGNGDGGNGGSSSTGSGNGTVTDDTVHKGTFEDADSKFEFIADADGFVSTATDKNTGSNTVTVVDGNQSMTIVSDNVGNMSSVQQKADSITSGVQKDKNSNISVDTANKSTQTIKGENGSVETSKEVTENGAVIKDTVSNTVTDEEGNKVTTTVTETKDGKGSSTVVSDGTNSSTVSQTTGGQTITTTVKDEEGNDVSSTTEITGSDVVINKGTDDEVSLAGTANRVDNLEEGLANVNARVGELEDRIEKVGAMAAAIANLRTMGYDPAAPTEVAVGVGQYRSETGLALGLFHYPNRDFMLSLSVSTSGDEVMGGIGATWRFGRKNPEKAAEIERVKKAEEIKRAAQSKKATTQVQLKNPVKAEATKA